MMSSRQHPLPLRIMHWVNAGAMLAMIGSGWGIYDDDVILRGIHVPQALRLGSWAAQSLLWHFAVMWVLAANGAAYLVYGLLSGRFRRLLLPIGVRALLLTVRDTLRLRLDHGESTTYNAVQKLLYVLAIGAGVLQVVTGLALWKPVQFSGLLGVLGGFQAARVIHFGGMAFLVGFLVVHVALSVLVPRTLWSMVTGGPRS